MPNDDLTVGRCEALSDAAMLPFKRRANIMAKALCGGGPMEELNSSIRAWEENKATAEAKLDALYALRAKLSDPECAKAVQAALELLR